MPTHRRDAFVSVAAGNNGLVATSLTFTTPGTASFWTSADGRRWTLSGSDPLGNEGAYVGSGANGLFSTDGTRLLGYGDTAPGDATQYWVSLDGADWARLKLTGDTAEARGGDLTPFLLRDGLLFSGDQGSWYGGATK